MEFFEEHLQASARRLYGLTAPDVVEQYADFVERFRSTAPERRRTRRLELPPAAESLVLGAAARALKQDGFEIRGGTDALRNRVEAHFERTYDCQHGWLATLPRRHDTLALRFDAAVEVGADGVARLTTSCPLPTWEDDFERRLRALVEEIPPHIRRLARAAKPERLRHNPLLRPGEELEEPFTGTLRDYSGCASDDEDEMAELRVGVLPLGRYTFGDDPATAYRGPDLYLGNWRTGAPMIFNGALICAPQNSGKTELIMRWAVAANRAGYSVFLVDVKGNLRDQLAPRLQGRLYYFSTDPYEESDCINFLDGLHGTTPENSMRIRQLVEALMPRDGWEQGEQAYYYQNHFNWFSALIHITLLTQHYYPEMFRQGRANLGHVFEIATNYRMLLACIRNAFLAEANCREARKPPAAPGIAYWCSEIALLLHPDDGGERTGDYSYRTLTQSIVNALRPFSRFGTLHGKIGGPRSDGSYPPPERYFSLEMLTDQEQPVTIILAAREQDLDDGTAVLDLTIRKLQQFLFERMRPPGSRAGGKEVDGRDQPSADVPAAPARRRPVLLLLDETRRIRGFKANEYITFARQAEAGCVIVYQSLDQIGEEPKIREILENVGTQIYLGSLTGSTARYFIDMLPIRFRPTFTINFSFGDGDGAPALQSGQQPVDYFTTSELYRLPGGAWPALVYINGLPRRKPFLVDLDRRFADDADPAAS